MRIRRGAPRALMLALLLAVPAQAARSSRSTVDPGVAKLGERVVYRGSVVADARETVRFMTPEEDSLVTWGTPQVGRTAYVAPRNARGNVARATIDTFWVEIPLQVFETGIHILPGLRYVNDPDPSDAKPGTVMRLPQVRLTIVPTLTAADSNATLREVHGPLAAPWWERVPWLWVIVGLLIAAAVVWLIRRLRRRKPVAAPAPVAKPAAARKDPLAEALADLRALKARRLPEAGEFSEHAFMLGRILRRYLEATVAITRPGDTTPELIQHLKLSALADSEVLRLGGLLRVWDRIKFARDPFTAEEAHRAEDSVEAFLQSNATPRKEVA